MNLAQYRADRGISLEECATQLGLSARSKGWISEIERGGRPASLRLALKIEQWSGGAVKAASLNPVAAELAAGAASDRRRARA